MLKGLFTLFIQCYLEEEKSKEQKEREDRLLKELFELIDERDRLEKRKMASMKM